SKYLADVNKAKLVGKPKPQNVDLPCTANFVFDLKSMIPFTVTSDMDVYDLVDDLISNADLNKKIQILTEKELRKHEWFNTHFSGIDTEIEEVDHGGKIQNLNAVAITVKLIFKAKVSVEDNKLASALTNV